MFDDTQALEFHDLTVARQRQECLLKNHLVFACEHSSHYRKTLQSFRSRLSSVTLETLQELPFTDKATFAEHNDEFLAAPKEEWEDIVFSSGTTGEPTPVVYTHRDIERLAYNERISIRACGVQASDVALMTCTLDRCFVAGYAYYRGLIGIGASAIRNGINTVESHARTMRRLRPNVVVGVPGFLRRLGEYLYSTGQSELANRVRIIICPGDPLRDRNMRPLPVTQRIAELWQNATIHSTYASSETITSFCECTAQCGGHLHPELAVLEIIGENGERLPSGEVGEVVVTPLQMQGMPLVRFRTGDISFLIEEPCPCGRTSPRLGPILGRKNQMMKIRGTTLYPPAILNALDEIHEIAASYVTVRANANLSDEVQATVALRGNTLTADEIAGKLRALLRVRPEVNIATLEEVNAKIYDPASHKPRRFFDERR